MVAAFDYCLHGKGGAAPSIDTAMHGLVDAAHVDHLHPDSGIAIATAADGEELTKEIFGDKVVWVPWRRPGLPARPRHRRDQGRRTRRRSAASSAGTASPRGATPARSAEANSLWIIDTAAAYIAEHGEGRAVRPGARRVRRAAGGRAPRQGRRARADDPRHRLARTGRWSATSPTPTWCWTSSRHAEHPRLAALGTSCPDHFLRTKVKPLVLDLPADGVGRGVDRPAAGAARAPTARTTRPTTTATPTPDSPADARRRPADRAGARRRHVQLRQGQADRPGGRRVLRQRDQRDARRRGALDVRPDRRVGEVPHRVLGAGGGQAPADAEAQAARDPDRAGHRRGVRASARRSRRKLAAEGACVVDRRPRRWRRRRPRPPSIGGPDVAVGVAGRRHATRPRSQAAVRRGRAGLRRRRPGRQQRRAVAVQAAAGDHRGRLGPPARRDGQGLVPGRPGRRRR